MNTNGAGHGKPDVNLLREEIQHTRQELGETVQALAAKADVKARARESVEHAKQRVLESVGHATELVRDSAGDVEARARRNPVPLAVLLAAGVALTIALIVLRGRRR